MAVTALSPQILERIRGHALILYDGDCGFCQYWVQFIIRHDAKAYFLFAPLQDLGLSLDTVLLYEDGVRYEKLSAVTKVAARLGFPWKLAILIRPLPRKLQNTFYDFVAKRRQHLSLSSFCKMPTADEQKRFIRLL